MSSNTAKDENLSRPFEEVRAKIKAQISEGEQILKREINTEQELESANQEGKLWRDYTSDLLSKLFNTDKKRREFASSVSSYNYSLSFRGKIEQHHRHTTARLNTLKSIFGRLELFEESVEKEETVAVAGAKHLNKKDIFVVHGRNDRLRRSIFDFLRALGLHPLEWPEALAATKQTSPYIGDILEASFSQAQAIVVLLSGDDVAKLQDRFLQSNDADYERSLTPQPRPNVIFEAGMAIGREPSRTVLVQVGKLRPWSDIAGRHVTHLDNSPEKRQELANKLKTAGCVVNTSGQDWYKVGDFSDEPNIDQEVNSSTLVNISKETESSRKSLILTQTKDLIYRVEQTLRDNDPTLDVEFRIEYYKVLQNAIFEWSLDSDLLQLKSEMSIFDAKRILRDDKLGGLKWTLNSAKKMLLILDSLGI